VTRGSPKTSLHVQIPTDLKRQVVDYATQTGISQAAATTLLLAAGLRAARTRK
jgi:hypothetical protein